jgi:peroxiredoxin
MHKKYAKDGLVAMSVNLDDPENVEVMKNVRSFLSDKGAAFVNFVLKEETKVWQEKLGIDGPPAVFVFDRDGKRAHVFKELVKYDEVEKAAVELLKKGK